MKMSGIPFDTTDWNRIEPTEHTGLTGVARWRTRQCGEIRIRMVEYSAGYQSDHWCSKGHVLLCLTGELDTELSDGRVMHLTPGVSYQVADGDLAHRSRTSTGATLFVVD